MKDQVLGTMKAAGKPVNVGDVVKLSGLERADVEKAFKELKGDGSIESPVRCKWQPANKQLANGRCLNWLILLAITVPLAAHVKVSAL